MHTLVPYLLIYSCDFEEMRSVCGLTNSCKCVHCWATGRQLRQLPHGGDPAESRTYEETEEACEAMLSALRDNKLARFKKLRERTQLQGPRPLPHVLWTAGLACHLAAELVQPEGVEDALELHPNYPFRVDDLHTFEEGLTKRLADATTAVLDQQSGGRGKKLSSTLTARLVQLVRRGRNLPGIRFPSESMLSRVFRGDKSEKKACTGFNAYELSALLRIMPVAVNSIPGMPDCICRLWCTYANAYMETKRLSRPPGYSRTTLHKVMRLRRELVRLWETTFSGKDVQKSEWCFPKVHIFGPHLATGVMLSGGLDWCSTQLGESSIKLLTAAFRRTNKQLHRFTQDVSRRLAVGAANRRMNRSVGYSAAPAGLGKSKSARARADASGESACVRATYGKTTLSKLKAGHLTGFL